MCGEPIRFPIAPRLSLLSPPPDERLSALSSHCAAPRHRLLLAPPLLPSPPRAVPPPFPAEIATDLDEATTNPQLMVASPPLQQVLVEAMAPRSSAASRRQSPPQRVARSLNSSRVSMHFCGVFSVTKIVDVLCVFFTSRISVVTETETELLGLRFC